MCGKWLSMNVLTLDEKRVVVERHHTSMINALEQWGFEPVPCDSYTMPRLAVRFIVRRST